MWWRDYAADKLAPISRLSAVLFLISAVTLFNGRNTMKSSGKIAVPALVLLALALPSMAAAQATRTWVSGVGDDANPCSRTAPCKTYAGAISKTAAGGEISVLDPGGFGALTITKAITINGDGTLASALASTVSAIVINAGPSDVVILRSLSLVSPSVTSQGLSGIRFISGGSLVVENSTIQGFSQTGIEVNVPSGGNVAVRNTSIIGGTTGVYVNGGGTVRVSLTGVTIKGMSNSAINASFGTTDVSNSTITQNGNIGLLAAGGILSAENVMLSGNGIGVWALPAGTVRLSNTSIYDNLTGIGCGGGTVASAGNNRKSGNGGGGIPACSPNATITVQ